MQRRHQTDFSKFLAQKPGKSLLPSCTFFRLPAVFFPLHIIQSRLTSYSNRHAGSVSEACQLMRRNATQYR